MSDHRVHSADIEPTRSGDHLLIINGQQAARFDSIQKALATRELFLKMEADRRVEDAIYRSGPYLNEID